MATEGGPERTNRAKRRRLVGALVAAALVGAFAAAWNAGRSPGYPEPKLGALRGRAPTAEFLDDHDWRVRERVRGYRIDRDVAAVLPEIRRDLGSRGVGMGDNWRWSSVPDGSGREWVVYLGPSESSGLRGRCVVTVYGARRRAAGFAALQWLRTRIGFP